MKSFTSEDLAVAVVTATVQCQECGEDTCTNVTAGVACDTEGGPACQHVENTCTNVSAAEGSFGGTPVGTEALRVLEAQLRELTAIG